MNHFFAKSLAVSLALVILIGVPAVLLADTGDAGDAGYEKEAKKEEASEKLQDPGSQQAVIIAIAAMVSFGCISAAYAVGRIGAAVMGAASEKPELLGRSIIFMGLAEGIAIYGLIISILILNRIM